MNFPNWVRWIGSGSSGTTPVSWAGIWTNSNPTSSRGGPWAWQLLYIGRVDPQKGIDTAVRALAQLPTQATLEVWGSGHERYVAEMQALAGELGLHERVRFRGWAGPADRLTAFRDADVVVFPVRWEEPFGLVPLEAMGLGRPVLSTARGGSTEFLRDGEN